MMLNDLERSSGQYVMVLSISGAKLESAKA